MTLDEAKNMYNMYKKNYDSIVARYGTGVRPSWVSADLAIEWHKMQQYADLVRELEANEISN